jgi:hypothetical protein
MLPLIMAGLGAVSPLLEMATGKKQDGAYGRSYHYASITADA